MTVTLLDYWVDNNTMIDKEIKDVSSINRALIWDDKTKSHKNAIEIVYNHGICKNVTTIPVDVFNRMEVWT